MTRLRSIRLNVHLGKKTLTWTLVHRTDDGRSVFDRGIHSGTQMLEDSPSSLLDIPEVLDAVLAHIMDRPQIGYVAQRPGAPGGDGGRLTVPLAAVCRGQCPQCGAHLDGGSLQR